MVRTPSKPKPKYKNTGHTYGECSKKRALIKQRIFALEKNTTLDRDSIRHELVNVNAMLNDFREILYILWSELPDDSGFMAHEDRSKIINAIRQQTLASWIPEEDTEE